jgi:hypothetical protein
VGNRPQDETPHFSKKERPLEDDELDRPEVEAQQCVQPTGTNGRGLLLGMCDAGKLGLFAVGTYVFDEVNKASARVRA